MRSAVRLPRVEFLDGRDYLLLERFGPVPEGFVTDGCSIPRVLWPLGHPLGTAFPAAVIHDWRYVEQAMTRWAADREFFVNLCELCRYGRARARVMWAAVRLGGWWAWRKRARTAENS